MKNQHISNLLVPVPIGLRTQVYEELLNRIESNDPLHHYSGHYGFELCLSLPVLLWGLSGMCARCPDGSVWAIYEVHKAFPEFHRKDIGLIESSDDLNKTRAELLKSWIEHLKVK